MILMGNACVVRDGALEAEKKHVDAEVNDLLLLLEEFPRYAEATEPHVNWILDLRDVASTPEDLYEVIELISSAADRMVSVKNGTYKPYQVRRVCCLALWV